MNTTASTCERNWAQLSILCFCICFNQIGADLTMDFADDQWDEGITYMGFKENMKVVLDTKTKQGKVLMVTYDPVKLFGVNFAIPHFTNDPQQVCLYYEVLFEKGFDFAIGGKLPGLYGGTQMCGGGEHRNCFSTRMMWRQGAAGEVYVYMTRAAEAKSREMLCAATNEEDEVKNICNPVYGWSYKRGALSFLTNKWNVVRQRVRMNTVNKADGELEVWVNDRNITVDSLTWRTEGDGVSIKGLFFSTYFGGHNSTWAPSKTVRAYFRNIAFRQCSNLVEQPAHNDTTSKSHETLSTMPSLSTLHGTFDQNKSDWSSFAEAGHTENAIRFGAKLDSSEKNRSNDVAHDLVDGGSESYTGTGIFSNARSEPELVVDPGFPGWLWLVFFPAAAIVLFYSWGLLLRLVSRHSPREWMVSPYLRFSK